MPYFSHDDIAQIATPPGPGLLGAIRLSGPRAFALLSACAEGLEDVPREGAARSAHPCRLRLELTARRSDGPRRKECRCPARAYLMPGPASYTREDVAEIHLPGSPVLLRAGLEAVIRAGARPAAPGEFTFRAFRNGRLTLAQAEAVEAVVRAGGEAERRAALVRLGEAEPARIRRWRETLLTAAAGLEAILDFPDDMPSGAAAADPAAALEAVTVDLELEESPLPGRDGVLEAGLPRVALAGMANAGKSSLLNAVLGRETALVSPEASTTHDVLIREVEWGGSRFLLADHPGFHPPAGDQAGEAADRAARLLVGADLTVWVLDGARGLDESMAGRLRRLSGRIVVAVNKSDLPAAIGPEEAAAMAAEAGLTVADAFRVSALAGDGIRRLLDRLADETRRLPACAAWNRRERLELIRAREHCRTAVRELAGPARLELAADDLRQAVEALSLAMGEGYSEEALTRIFASFCVGK